MGYKQGGLITTTVAARMLNIHINTVRRWSDQGILKAYRIGPRGDRRFVREDVIGVLKTDDYGYKTSTG
ncbi:MAG: helix-turn-helix domain-containing protein [Dehalococcoidales bacterium]|nr:helix-turn-helix domain-containing protein [Dehalococcoidales bacterium]